MCVCAAQLHGLDRVHQLLVAEEQRRGQLYVRVVVSRLDHVWLAAHPPLSLLTATCAWVPRAEDYGGLNDRHAVLSREHADAYLGRWQMISSGRIMKLHPKLKLGIANGLTGERTLAAIMDALGIRVCRFAPVSFLACCAPAIDVQQKSSTGGASCHEFRDAATTHGARDYACLSRGCRAVRPRARPSPSAPALVRWMCEASTLASFVRRCCMLSLCVCRARAGRCVSSVSHGQTQPLA